MKKSQLRNIIKEELILLTENKEFINKWSKLMVDTLKTYKLPFSDNPKVTDIKVEFLYDYALGISCKTPMIADIASFNIHILLTDIGDVRRINNHKWQLEVTFSSPQKKGQYSKKTTGKNATPKMATIIIDNMFNLVYHKQKYKNNLK